MILWTLILQRELRINFLLRDKYIIAMKDFKQFLTLESGPVPNNVRFYQKNQFKNPRNRYDGLVPAFINDKGKLVSGSGRTTTFKKTKLKNVRQYNKYNIPEDNTHLHDMEPEHALQNHGWKPSVSSGGNTNYHHPELPGHEIRVQTQSGDWHHWDKSGEAKAAGFTGDALQHHLSTIQGSHSNIFKEAFLRIEDMRKAGKNYKVCPECGSPNFGLMPTDFETAKCSDCGKNYSRPNSPKQYRESYNPIPGNDAGDKNNDRMDYASKIPNGEASDLGVNGPRASTNMEAAKPTGTPSGYAPSDYSPRIASGNNIMPESNTAHQSLKANGWKLSLNKTAGQGIAKYTHPNLPGHEIHVSNKNFLHQDTLRDRDVAHGSHEDLKNHLNTMHGLKEGIGFNDPSNHPFHATAIKTGFKHTASSSALGAATHIYAHKSSNEPLHLKTDSGGFPSWHHGNRSGTNAASLAFHGGGLTEGLDMPHPFHKTLTDLGYEKQGSNFQPDSKLVNNRYTQKTGPDVTLQTIAGKHHYFTVHHKSNERKDISGDNETHLKRAIASHVMKEGILDLFKPKIKSNIPAKISPHYKTNHTYAVGGDIEPSTVPVFKPSYDYKIKPAREE